MNCLKIGDNNIIEAKSYLGRQANLSNGCIIGAGCKINTGKLLESMYRVNLQGHRKKIFFGAFTYTEEYFTITSLNFRFVCQ